MDVLVSASKGWCDLVSHTYTIKMVDLTVPMTPLQVRGSPSQSNVLMQHGTAVHMYTCTSSPCHLGQQAGGQAGHLGGEVKADEVSHEIHYLSDTTQSMHGTAIDYSMIK